MKALERKEKFNEFARILQEGTLGSSEIASKLCISINTLYNWRKRIRTECRGAQKANRPVSPFSKIAFKPQPDPTNQSFIEINIANTIVMRIPSNVSVDNLHAILDHFTNRGMPS
jgi:hypothetical protein